MTRDYHGPCTILLGPEVKTVAILVRLTGYFLGGKRWDVKLDITGCSLRVLMTRRGESAIGTGSYSTFLRQHGISKPVIYMSTNDALFAMATQK
jgi:hypothetical protein